MFKNLFLVGLVAAIACPAAAITVTIDGVSSPTLLSDAVDTCMSASDGPDIINITTDTLPVADRQIFINQPITINGDADNNSIACDVLVDMTGIRAADDIGIDQFKSYIEVQAAGDVTINNLKIHPNADGGFLGAAQSAAKNVSGIRFFKPLNGGDIGIYNMTKVWVSGSNSDGSFATLADGSDLYNAAGAMRWGGLNGSTESNFVLHAAIHYSEFSGGAGTISSILDHCQAGLSKGCAINVAGSGTNVQILGGVYGHSARDAIRISGSSTASIKGTVADRVRVLRSTNISGGNSHAVEVIGLATATLIEYVDAAGVQTANMLSLRDATINEVNYFRGLGKFITPGLNAPVNEPVFITSATNDIDLIRNSTFHAVYANVTNVADTVVNPIEFRDNIYTASSTTSTIIIASATPGVATFDNCAITTDGVAGESLAPVPFTGAGAVSPSLTVNNAVSASPQYMLTLADYDWSDNQGASNPLNGAGNRNVLRPAITNIAYLTSSSTGGRLTGGAGPDLAGIDDWMMME